MISRDSHLIYRCDTKQNDMDRNESENWETSGNLETHLSPLLPGGAYWTRFLELLVGEAAADSAGEGLDSKVSTLVVAMTPIFLLKLKEKTS